jgi:hypothetical protein
MYLGLSTAVPIFAGGILRWLTDRIRGVAASDAEAETSPGVLFSSGYIAGGTLCGLLLGFLFMIVSPSTVNIGEHLGLPEDVGNVVSLVAFLALCAILVFVGVRKTDVTPPPSAPQPETRIKAD